VVDRAGNENSTTYSVEVDTTEPLVSVFLPLPDSWVSSRSFLVSGVTEESARVSINDIEADRKGAEFSVMIDAAEGPFEIWVDVVDVAGNTKQVSFHVIIDTTPPELVISEPAEGLITRDPSLEFKGMVHEDGWLNLTVDGKTTVPVQWLWSQVVILNEGPNQIVVKAEDGAGHVVIATRNVTLDTSPPEVTVQLVVGDLVFNPLPEEVIISRDRAHLTVHVSEPCEVLVQGVGTFEVDEGTVSIELLLVENEENTVVVNGIDEAGNVAGAMTHTITVDRTPPEISVFEPIAHSIMDSPEVVIRGSTEPGAYLTVDGRIVNVEVNGTFSLVVTLFEGENTFLIVSEDALGNTNDCAYTLEYRTPEAPPEDEVGYRPIIMVTLAIAAIVALVVLVWSRYR
jgi:hypothetical protein